MHSWFGFRFLELVTVSESFLPSKRFTCGKSITIVTSLHIFPRSVLFNIIFFWVGSHFFFLCCLLLVGSGHSKRSNMPHSVMNQHEFGRMPGYLQGSAVASLFTVHCTKLHHCTLYSITFMCNVHLSLRLSKKFVLIYSLLLLFP